MKDILTTMKVRPFWLRTLLLLLFSGAVSCSQLTGGSFRISYNLTSVVGPLVSFPNTVVGTQSVHSIQLTNGGAQSVNLLQELRPLTAPFSFFGGTFPGTGGTCGAGLAAGESCVLVFSFSPTHRNPPGATEQMRWIREYHNPASEYGVITLDFEGRGVHPANLIATPDPVDFGNINPSRSQGSQVIGVIRNIGEFPATLEASAGIATLLKTGSISFDIVNVSCGSVLAPGEQCEYQAHFIPDFQTEQPPYSAQLLVNYADGITARSLQWMLSGDSQYLCRKHVAQGSTNQGLSYEFGASNAATQNAIAFADRGPYVNKVQVYHRESNDQWSTVPTIISYPHPGMQSLPTPRFGFALAMKDDLLVIGAPDDIAFGPQGQMGIGAGVVYVYQRTSDTQWTLKQEIHAPPANLPGGQACYAFGTGGAMRFGAQLSFKGDTLVIAAPGYDFTSYPPTPATHFGGGLNPSACAGHNADTGAFFVYSSSPGSAAPFLSTPRQVLIPSQPASSSGDSLRLTHGGGSSGDEFLMLGQPYATASAGSVSEVVSVGLSDAAEMAADGALPLQGLSSQVAPPSQPAPPSSGGGTLQKAGTVYAYRKNASTGLYEHIQQLFAPAKKAEAYYGIVVDVDGGWLAIGAFGENAAHLYAWDSSSLKWQHKQRLSQGTDSYFGRSLALSDNRLIVGSPRATVAGAAGNYHGAFSVYGYVPSLSEWRLKLRQFHPEALSNSLAASDHFGSGYVTLSPYTALVHAMSETDLLGNLIPFGMPITLNPMPTYNNSAGAGWLCE